MKGDKGSEMVREKGRCAELLAKFEVPVLGCKRKSAA